jgi:hypothetical protein
MRIVDYAETPVELMLFIESFEDLDITAHLLDLLKEGNI